MFSGKTRSILALLALAASGPASALGFGEVRAQVFLGQTLNLAVPVQLGEGESLGAECASAEVQLGETRLQPGLVRVRVTQGGTNAEAVVRIVSTVVIDEPVVNVTLSAGCPTRITRTLVLLADPPLVNTAAVVSIPRESTADAPLPRSVPQAPVAAAPAPAAAPAAAPRPPRATRPAAPARANRASASAGVSAPRPAAALPAAPASSPTAAATVEATTARPVSAPASRPSVGAARAGRPRLELDPGLVAANQAAVQAAEARALAAEAQVVAARQAASEAEASASAAAQRMKDLEAEVARMRAETQAQTQALVALRAQIAQDQAQRSQPAAQQGWLVPALFAATALFAALSLWLGLRSRREPEPAPPPRGDVWWDRGESSEPSAADPGEDSTYSPPTYQPSSRAPLRMPSAPAPLTVREGPPTDIGLDSLIAPPTVAAPVAVTIPPVAPRLDDSSRAVSVDEQIDLEQQADFFIALGHDESAIDLLMAHLRSTGGGTPLPFLKLLEIHRRRSDREAYERTRVRFNQRFNSVAPEWTSDPGAGRALEDYPLVVGRIQHVWANPLDAMAELEALLFRRGIGSEMFDLPAYQEVLFLYQLARDLHQADRPEEADNVDVLLPIGAAVEAAPEGTIVLRPEFNGGQAVSLDLDLTTKTGEIDTSASSGAELELDPAGRPSQTGDLPWPGDDDQDDKPRRS